MIANCITVETAKILFENSSNAFLSSIGTHIKSADEQPDFDEMSTCDFFEWEFNNALENIKTSEKKVYSDAHFWDQDVQKSVSENFEKQRLELSEAKVLFYTVINHPELLNHQSSFLQDSLNFLSKKFDSVQIKSKDCCSFHRKFHNEIMRIETEANFLTAEIPESCENRTSRGCYIKFEPKN